MIRYITLLNGFLLSASCLATFGCGSNSEAEAQPQAKVAPTAMAAQERQPEDVVAQFLDRVRRGGEESSAGDLLTRKAQAELERIGRTVQPIGSPDAQFEVTRSQLVPGEEASALVHSLWREPAGDGTVTEYQVVWAVERDPGEWRISGLAMEITPGQDPEIIDFENGELMAQLLTEAESPANDSLSQPASPQIQPTPPHSQSSARPETSQNTGQAVRR